jgi:hypothetical protein
MSPFYIPTPSSYRDFSVASSFLEIIQLPNGDIVLQRAGEDSEPLVNIRFSDEARDYIADAEVDIAKLMIQAGIQAAAHINEAQKKGTDGSVSSEWLGDEGVVGRNRTLH